MKVRKIGVARQILIIMAVLVLLMNIIIGGVLSYKTREMLTSQIRNKAENLASCAAGQVDGALFEQITEEKGEDDAYLAVYEVLSGFLDNSDLEYVYSFRKGSAGLAEFVVDTDPEDPAAIGEEYDCVDGMEQAFLGETTSDSTPTSDEWGTYISAYSPIFSDGSVVGIVGVDVSYDWIQGQLRQISGYIITICALIFVLLFVAIYLLGRRLNGSFRLLNDKISELADGSGDLEREVVIRSGDEFEVIAESVNRFIKQINSLVFTVGQMSRRNAETITDMNNGIMELSANMQECSATGESVSANLSSTARQVSDLAAQISEVEQQVQNSSSTAQNSSRLARDHQEIAVKNIEKIRQEILAATKEAQSIEQVKSIATQISDIAMQTRILSLNAQLEASRAGDQGLGFEVVATQVENLSGQIEEAVSKIGEINDRIQAATRELMDSVDEMNEFMSSDVLEDYKVFAQLGNEYGLVTGQIKESMEALKDQSAEIAKRVEIADSSIQDISKAVSDSAGKIERLSGASGTISEQMSKLLSVKILQPSRGR